MNFKIHKDKLPQDTIKEIRNILSELNIFLQESNWFSVTKDCYSVNISNMELPGCFSNGKGVSKHYALASAYAEFMERLQSDFLIKKNFGIMEKDDFSYPDEIEQSLGLYAEKNSVIIDNLIDSKTLEKYKDFKIKCLPYYGVIEDEIKYLPDFIHSTANSNGLCAGNTKEEAICQGICEIFERFVVKEIYFNDNIELPTIPLSALKELEIYSIIDEVIKKGYGVLIKDCTLDGKFPVIGVILIDRKKNSYIYAFGSDPIFEVALQRCMTELFQGRDNAALKSGYRAIKFDFSSKQFINKKFLSEEDNKKIEYQQFFLRRAGELPNRIFTSKKESIDYNKGFQKVFKDHKDSLIFLTDIIKRNNYKMYIQDLSYLEFPSFRVFIPEISVIKKLNYEKFRALYAEKDFLKSVLLRLKKSTTKDIQKCANLLEPLINIPEDYYHCRSFICSSLLEIIIDGASHIAQFDNLIYLLGMLFFHLENYEKAFKYLDFYIKEAGNNYKNLDYYTCVILYLRLKSDKRSENEIRIVLKNTFGEKLSREVIDDLSKPEECFKYFVLPECGNCSTCPISKECYYDKWKDINSKIIQKIKNNPVKQEDISKIF